MHLESEVNPGARVLFPLGVTLFSKFYNPNLHNIDWSGRIGFKMKNPHVANHLQCSILKHKTTLNICVVGYTTSLYLVMICQWQIQVGGTEKHEICAAAFGCHLFLWLIYTRPVEGGHGPLRTPGSATDLTND